MMETQEYCLIYAKDKNNFEIGVLPIDEESSSEWKQDEIGWWKEGGSLKATGEAAHREARPNLFFPIYIDEKNPELNLTLIQFYAMQELARLYPEKRIFETTTDKGRFDMFDKVSGTSKIRTLFSKRNKWEDVRAYWYKDAETFRKLSKKYYLYR